MTQPRSLGQFIADTGARCPDCGHDLRGLRDARCPECGRGLVLRLEDRRDRALRRLFALLGLWAVISGLLRIAGPFYQPWHYARLLREMQEQMQAELGAADRDGFLGLYLVLFRGSFNAWYAISMAVGALLVGLGLCLIRLVRRGGLGAGRGPEGLRRAAVLAVAVLAMDILERLVVDF